MFSLPNSLTSALLAAQNETKRVLGHLEARTPMGFMKVRVFEKVGYRMPLSRDELEWMLADIEEILSIIAEEEPLVIDTADVLWKDGGVFHPRQALESARFLLST